MPIEATLSGTDTVSRDVQSPKADSFIEVTLSGMVTDLREWHSKNTDGLMIVMLFGRETVSRAQLSNAKSPM